MTGNLNFEQEPFPEYNAREEKAKEKARLKEEARLAKEEAKRKEREEKVCQKRRDSWATVYSYLLTYMHIGYLYFIFVGKLVAYMQQHFLLNTCFSLIYILILSI